jgi:TolB-like protein/tetratricopeptide (TPR) repeat protein
MGLSPSEMPPSDRPVEERLDSWKEIATYVKRDITTVQRWEKREGMPVHRHLHHKRESVYAFSSELDAWIESRARASEDEAKEQERIEVGSRNERTGSDVKRPGSWISVRLLLLGAVLMSVAGTIAYFAINRHRAIATPPKITSLAVLPLKNLSSDPSQEYLADGMTEAVISRLSGIRDLRVISRTSVMSFKDTKLSAPEIAEKLHVDALVEGSVIRDGNRIRVHAQLIRAATDEHFWSEEYDRDLKDVLALQSDVAQSIASKVEVTVTGKERERLSAAHQVSPEVYESYLKAWSAFGKSRTKADIEQTITYFDETTKKDPNFAPAWVGLAQAYSELGTVFVGGQSEETKEKVLASARRALEIDSQSADAYLLLASVQQKRWQWAEAEVGYKRALELSPNNASAHEHFARWLVCQGRTQEAVDWAQRGRQLDPLAVSGSGIAWILFQSHRFGEALHELHSQLAVHPDDEGALSTLGFVLIANNQPNDAIPVLEKVLVMSDRSPAAVGVLTRAYAHAGRRADALRLVGDLKARKQKGYVPAGAFVNAYLGLGDNEEALAWLEKAYAEHSNIVQWMKVHPYMDPLRGDPRFQDLLHRVGLDRTY